MSHPPRSSLSLKEVMDVRPPKAHVKESGGERRFKFQGLMGDYPKKGGSRSGQSGFGDREPIAGFSYYSGDVERRLENPFAERAKQNGYAKREYMGGYRNPFDQPRGDIAGLSGRLGKLDMDEDGEYEE
jgi:hypothetical protein